LSLRRSRLSLIFSRTLNGFLPKGSSLFTFFPRVFGVLRVYIVILGVGLLSLTTHW
jgi:hypothetical protein